MPRGIKRLGEAEPEPLTEEEQAQLEVVGTDLRTDSEREADEQAALASEELAAQEAADQTEGSSSEGTSEAN